MGDPLTKEQYEKIPTVKLVKLHKTLTKEYQSKNKIHWDLWEQAVIIGPKDEKFEQIKQTAKIFIDQMKVIETQILLIDSVLEKRSDARAVG